MGTKMAPSHVNLFMGNLEEKFCKKEPHRPDFWKRFIDNILCVWTGSRESLEALLRRLNSCHPTIHFTWTISEDSLEFLDTRIYKGSRFSETGILDIETHFKPTNSFQYLHFSSSHPKVAFKGGKPLESLGPTQARPNLNPPSPPLGITSFVEDTLSPL